MTKIEILDKLKSDVVNIPFEADNLSTDFNFTKNDVRYYFYGLFQNTINQYYLGWNILFFFEEVDSNEIYKLYTDQNLNEFKKNHIEKLFFIQYAKPKETYQKNLNRNLVLSSFSTFETCINLIFENLVNKEDFNEYLKKMTLTEEKSFLNYFDENQKTRIISKLLINHSLHKKYRFLSKNKYDFMRKDDLDFIKFISDYRNSLIHNNGIFNNQGYEKEVFGVKFIFEKGKEVLIEENENSFLLNWEISFKMKQIFTRLISNLKHPELILYPD